MEEEPEKPKVVQPAPDVSPKPESFDCTFCDRSFGTKQGVTMHIRKAHKDHTPAEEPKSIESIESIEPVESAAVPASRELPAAPDIEGSFVLGVQIVKMIEFKVSSLEEMRSRLVRIREAFGGSLKGIKVRLGEGEEAEGESD